MILTFIVFTLIIGVAIFVHELGHFIAAKKAGVLVEEFSIGFPPTIWKKKIGPTQYSLGLIPFGGFNKIYGMDSDQDSADNPQSYESKTSAAKLAITLGGIVMNILLSALVFYFLLGFSNFTTYQSLVYTGYEFCFGEQTNYPAVADIGESSSIEGINKKDIIVSADGVRMENASDLYQYVKEHKNEEIVLELDNMVSENKRSVTVKGEDLSGFGVGNVAKIEYESVSEKIFSGFLHSFNFVDYSFAVLGYMTKSSIEKESVEPLASSFSGPVGILAVTKITVEQGIYSILNLLAILSLALAITNILPIPALDGAKCIFIILALINQKVFSKELQFKLEQGGMAFLILLAILITFKDFFQFKDILF